MVDSTKEPKVKKIKARNVKTIEEPKGVEEEKLNSGKKGILKRKTQVEDYGDVLKLDHFDDEVVAANTKRNADYEDMMKELEDAKKSKEDFVIEEPERLKEVDQKTVVDQYSKIDKSKKLNAKSSEDPKDDAVPQSVENDNDYEDIEITKTKEEDWKKPDQSISDTRNEICAGLRQMDSTIQNLKLGMLKVYEDIYVKPKKEDQGNGRSRSLDTDMPAISDSFLVKAHEFKKTDADDEAPDSDKVYENDCMFKNANQKTDDEAAGNGEVNSEFRHQLNKEFREAFFGLRPEEGSDSMSEEDKEIETVLDGNQDKDDEECPEAKQTPDFIGEKFETFDDYDWNTVELDESGLPKTVLIQEMLQ